MPYAGTALWPPHLDCLILPFPQDLPRSFLSHSRKIESGEEGKREGGRENLCMGLPLTHQQIYHRQNQQVN